MSGSDGLGTPEGEHLLPPLPTRSLERCLVPLVLKISSLVTSPNERGGVATMTSRAVGRVGQAVNVAVDRFVTVGETIADDNPEIKVDMYEACKEARAAGSAIEKLCESAESSCDHTSPVGVMAPPAGGVTQEYRATMIRAARCLLSSVTRVLLLADTVVVKQLLLSKDKVTHSLSRLESVTNFTEFVKAFSQFGAEMVELAQLTSDRQADLKDDRRRAQMAAARQVLDRSTMMLLTASKVCLRHPECITSRENRDTVFCQMRRAMDLIHYVVKDGVLEAVGAPGEPRLNGQSPGESPSGLRTRQEDWDSNHTVYGAIKHLEESVEMTRVTLCGPAVRERLSQALDAIGERSQDFTDSAYTSHEHRQTILLLTDRIRLELNHLLRVGVSLEQREIPSPSDELESAIGNVATATKELKKELQNTALEQAQEIVRGSCEESELMSALKNAGLATDQERLDEYADRFLEHVEHIQEVCKLLRHIATTDSLQVAAKYGEINLRIYGPQVVTAAQTLCHYPTSKIAKENVEVFADMWLNLVGDVKSLTKDVGDQILADSKPPEKRVYMSLPRPGKHGTTTKAPKPTKLDREEQAKLAKSGLDMKMISSEVDQEAEKWEERITQDEDNDIVKRAKNMSSMAFSMYQFTRGEGALKTTQDLFTQGEYFAEEANRLYKVVRQFSYQVPAGPQKKELMEHLDQIPTYVQSLQFIVKNPTVGKAATFTKVDNVIQETKNLMNVISKVVTTCFVCATKFELKLPERLQLPSLDEIRADGYSNPMGQVFTLSSEEPSTPLLKQLLPPQPPETAKDTETPSISAALEGIDHLLDSPTIHFLETQVNLKDPLDIQSTIKTLQVILTKLSLQNIKQIEFQQNIEKTISSLVLLQNSQDLETRQTLRKTIHALQNLQASHNLHPLMASRSQSTTFQELREASQIVAHPAKEDVLFEPRPKPSADEMSALPPSREHSNQSSFSSSSILSPDPCLSLSPRFSFVLRPSANLPPNSQVGENFSAKINYTFSSRPNPSPIPNLNPAPSSNVSYNLYPSVSSSLNVSPTLSHSSSVSLSHALTRASNLSLPSGALHKHPWAVPHATQPAYSSSSNVCVPKSASKRLTAATPSNSLQYLDLQTSLISPLNTQLSSKHTDDVLNFLSLERNKQFSKYGQTGPVHMTSQPDLKNTLSLPGVENVCKDLNFRSLSTM